jgi:hypothetical protein
MLSIILCISVSFAQTSGFIHPLDYKVKDKQKVLDFIKMNVKETYTKIGMGDPLTLRMMEKGELDAFKELTKVKNRELLDKVITTYCEMGMCTYTTILMMYKEQLKASTETLDW